MAEMLGKDYEKARQIYHDAKKATANGSLPEYSSENNLDLRIMSGKNAYLHPYFMPIHFTRMKNESSSDRPSDAINIVLEDGRDFITEEDMTRAELLGSARDVRAAMMEADSILRRIEVAWEQERRLRALVWLPTW